MDTVHDLALPSFPYLSQSPTGWVGWGCREEEKREMKGMGMKSEKEVGSLAWKGGRRTSSLIIGSITGFGRRMIGGRRGEERERKAVSGGGRRVLCGESTAEYMKFDYERSDRSVRASPARREEDGNDGE